MNFYSIKDKHVNMFSPPFLSATDEDARKVISDSVEVGSILAKFPEDYILVKLAEFDPVKGFVSLDTEFVCSMRDIVRTEIIDRTLILANLVDSKEVTNE